MEYHNRTDRRAFDVLIRAIENADLDQLRKAVRTCPDAYRDFSTPAHIRPMGRGMAQIIRKQIKQYGQYGKAKAGATR